MHAYPTADPCSTAKPDSAVLPWATEIQLTKRGRRFSVVFRSFSEEQLLQVGARATIDSSCSDPE